MFCRRASFRCIPRQVQERLPQQSFVSLHLAECPFATDLHLWKRFSHFRCHALHDRLQRHRVIRNLQRPRVLQKLCHHVRNIPRLPQDTARILRSILLRCLRNQLRITGNCRQRILELVRDARGQFSQRGQILLELHPLLQCCKLRQIRQQTDCAADAFRPAPDRRNRHSQMPRISRRGNMLHFFATVNLSRRKALRQQLRQVRVLAQRFAVPPESQPVNSQHLFRSRI